MLTQEERVKRNLQSIYGTNELLKALEGEEMMKGRRANIGEVREWQGKKYRKTTQGVGS